MKASATAEGEDVALLLIFENTGGAHGVSSWCFCVLERED